MISMMYNQPWDQPTNPNAPYIDGNPAAGIQGSIVPAYSIEYDQREIVEVINRAHLRGYHDYSGAACAAPSNSDLQQLRKALEGFLAALPNWYIDTDVTFTVHGSGANFPDLNEALWYLSKYVITHHGHVTLAVAAGQWSYNTEIRLDHPNADRILITGANLLSYPVNTDFAVTGYTVLARQNDRTNTLNRLRTRFATEIDFVGGGSINNYSNGMMLQNILIVGDRASGGGLGSSIGCLIINNISVVNSGGSGVGVSAALSQVNGGFLSSSGSIGHGIAVACGGNHWHGANTNTWVTSNDGNGVGAGFNCGSNGYSTFVANGNGGAGVTCSVMGEYQLGGSSQFNMNAVNGIFIDQGVCYIDNYPPGGSGGGAQLNNNGGAGVYITVDSSFQAGYAKFSGNAGGLQIVCGSHSFAYIPNATITGSISPPLNILSSDGSIIQG
jgi:hypothetical protein